jgi:hypothetical protein
MRFVAKGSKILQDAKEWLGLLTAHNLTHQFSGKKKERLDRRWHKILFCLSAPLSNATTSESLCAIAKDTQHHEIRFPTVNSAGYVVVVPSRQWL